ncbi:MAG: choice-of-anchor tandem repeat GloVer-containing protein [Methylocella sp.]
MLHPRPPFPSGCGVVFKLSPSGIFTVLHTFTGGSDGKLPEGALLADSSGNLYGATYGGGTSNRGTVFKLTPGGTETVLHTFTGGSDGLIADSSGNLYGTTIFGGASNAGVVFKLSPTGTETVLYSFTGGSDGAFPQAGLYADSNGNLFGTTNGGGASGNGVVFKLAGTGFEVPTLQVTPAANIQASVLGGLLLGPSSFSYQLSATTGSINVSILGIPSWLNASFTSATVTATSPTAVTLSVNLDVILGVLLNPNATITFTNTTNGQGSTTRTATLKVL